MNEPALPWELLDEEASTGTPTDALVLVGTVLGGGVDASTARRGVVVAAGQRARTGLDLGPGRVRRESGLVPVTPARGPGERQVWGLVAAPDEGGRSRGTRRARFGDGRR